MLNSNCILNWFKRRVFGAWPRGLFQVRSKLVQIGGFQRDSVQLRSNLVRTEASPRVHFELEFYRFELHEFLKNFLGFHVRSI